MKSFNIIIYFIAFLFMGACTKMENKFGNQPNQVQLTGIVSENVGTMHNSTLDYMSSISGFEYLDDGEALDSIIKFQVENYFPDLNVEDVKVLVTDSWEAAKGEPIGEDYIKHVSLNYYNLELISSRVNNYLINLSEIFDEMRYEDIETSLIYIEKLEEEVNEDEQLSTDEKRLLLEAFIISRYSNEYWHAEINDSSSPWQIQFPIFDDLEQSIWYRIRRAAADVRGYLDGWFNNEDPSLSNWGSGSISASLYSDAVNP